MFFWTLSCWIIYVSNGLPVYVYGHFMDRSVLVLGFPLCVQLLSSLLRSASSPLKSRPFGASLCVPFCVCKLINIYVVPEYCICVYLHLLLCVSRLCAHTHTHTPKPRRERPVESNQHFNGRFPVANVRCRHPSYA